MRLFFDSINKPIGKIQMKLLKIKINGRPLGSADFSKIFQLLTIKSNEKYKIPTHKGIKKIAVPMIFTMDLIFEGNFS